MDVKIIKCSKSTYWYNNKVGQTIEVDEAPHNPLGYRVSSQKGVLTGIISFEDAEVLPKTK